MRILVHPMLSNHTNLAGDTNWRVNRLLIEAMLPKRHGFDVCLDMKRSEHGSTPVVIVTSVYKGRKYRTQAIHQYKCDEYLEKPLAAEKLLETIDLMLPDDETPVQTAPAEETAPPSPSTAAPTPVAKVSSPDQTEEDVNTTVSYFMEMFLPTTFL